MPVGSRGYSRRVSRMAAEFRHTCRLGIVGSRGHLRRVSRMAGEFRQTCGVGMASAPVAFRNPCDSRAQGWEFSWSGELSSICSVKFARTRAVTVCALGCTWRISSHVALGSEG